MILKSKKSLVSWSMVLGIIFTLLNFLTTKFQGCPTLAFSGCSVTQVSGWPMVYAPYYPSDLVQMTYFPLLIDLLTWILIALVVLSIARYFLHKQVSF